MERLLPNGAAAKQEGAEGFVLRQRNNLSVSLSREEVGWSGQEEERVVGFLCISKQMGKSRKLGNGRGQILKDALTKRNQEPIFIALFSSDI